VSRARPGKRRDLLFRDRALTVAIAVAAVAATLLVIRAASGQPPPTLRALVEDRHQGRTAEWWARRTTIWKRRAQRRDLRIHRLRAANRRRWTPTLERGIQLAAIAYRQPATLLYRVAWCESRFFLYARSAGGHLGPFQFLPSTWRSTPYARFSPFDPTAAPLAAAWMWAQGRRGEWAC
jgi:hypothetical protein